VKYALPRPTANGQTGRLAATGFAAPVARTSLPQSQPQEGVVSKLDGTFWYCVRHRRVEPYDGCKNADRVGPFQTEAEAADAMQTIAEREERYETEDSEWNDDR
jgi:hypothetical protein